MRSSIPSCKAYLGNTDHLKSHNNHLLAHYQHTAPTLLFESSFHNITINGTQQKIVILKETAHFLENLKQYYDTIATSQKSTSYGSVLAGISHHLRAINNIVQFESNQKLNRTHSEREERERVVMSYRQKIQEYSIRINELESFHHQTILKLEESNSQNQVLADYNVHLKQQINQLSTQINSQKTHPCPIPIPVSNINHEKQRMNQQLKEQIKLLQQQIQKQKDETIEIIEGYKNQIQKIIDSQHSLKQSIQLSMEKVRVLETEKSQLLKVIQEESIQAKRNQEYWNSFKTNKEAVIRNYEAQVVLLRQEVLRKQNERAESEKEIIHHQTHKHNLDDLEDNQSIEDIIQQIQENSQQLAVRDENQPLEQLVSTLKILPSQLTQRQSTISSESHVVTITTLDSNFSELLNPQLTHRNNSLFTKRNLPTNRVEQISRH